MFRQLAGHNIIDAVEVLRQARETDTVVLFIAGRGVNEGPSYRFLPTDATWMAGGLRGSTVVPWQVPAGGGGGSQGEAAPVRRHQPLRQRQQPQAWQTPPSSQPHPP